MVRKEAPPRVKTAHHRGRGSRGGRGGRGGNRQAPVLESNEFRMAQFDERDPQEELLKATIDACSRPLPIPVPINENNFSEDELKIIAEKLSKLSLQEQMETDFLVPEPPMEDEPAEEKIVPSPAVEKPVVQKKEEPKDLDAWLSGLLG